MIGASEAPDRIGGRSIHSMLNGGFGGAIYPVNPKRDTVQGLRAYPSINEVPEPVDCALIAVPATAAVDVIQDCADRGVRSAVMFTSGFAESDAAGAAAQERIREIGKSSGMRIAGPNCLGVFTLDKGWYGTFVHALANQRVPPGPIGIVSQSGSYGSHLFNVSQRRGVGTNHWVTTGNEVDVDVAEVIEYYAGVPDLRVIMAYAEGISDAGRLCRALAAAREAEKPVIFMKVGTTDVGARAAASHTAALAGADAIYDGVFEQYGVYRAETTEEMVDVAYACQFGRYPKGRRLSVQTISGGVGVQMADAATRRGLDVAPMPAPTAARMKELIPFAAVDNPVDFTAQALNNPELMQANIALTIEEGGYDAHVVYLSGVPDYDFSRQACLQIFSAMRERHPDVPVLVIMVVSDELRARYEELGLPCFEDPSLAVRAAAALSHFAEVFVRGAPEAPPAPLADAMEVPSDQVAEHAAKQIIASAGLAVSHERLVNSAEAAVAAWREIDGPVALKIVSPDIQHKTEIGGVLLNLDDEATVYASYATLIERAAAARPGARIDGVLVAEMVSGGVEMVVGVVHDPVFGPTVMCGLGGVLVEVLHDVQFRMAPFGTDVARAMVEGLAGRAILDGVRGAPPVDVEALAEALARLSVFAHANAARLESLDLNPFIVLPDGAVAVDALIVPREDCAI
ncbi:acetate--CoA ligase family protein [Marinovum algicola]|uniref:acetate--CoA ligase family protein n=1 Tax=Marinovum algicola TaxID=42444 RepID=UPI001FCD71B3|nr:acetate--CoA ligase family protein [Marinovum algicola]